MARLCSTLTPSYPQSWSHPWVSRTGLARNWEVGSKNRYRCEALSPSNEGGRTMSGKGTDTGAAAPGSPSSSMNAASVTESLPLFFISLILFNSSFHCFF
ncbi:hypothetical protein LguiA_020282 [Lonicera macranthoides]